MARLFGLDPLHPDAVDAYRSALRERRVGGMLRKLGAGWRVLHAVPHGELGEIDHLVIGPAGVFAVTMTPPDADRGARSASRQLTRAIGRRITAEPLVVTVADAPRLVAALRELPARLEADVVARVARAAEEWTTWRPLGVDLPSHTDPDAAFERLRTAVQRARRNRVLWSLTGLVTTMLAAVGTASALLR